MANKIKVVALVLLLVSLTGCARLITASGEGALSLATPINTVPILTPAPVQHDVAVTAVEFDPRFSSELLQAHPVSVSAVIENKGNQRESNILVEAILSGETDKDRLLHCLAQIDNLVPGESKVIRFGTTSQVPLRTKYVLKVEAKLVPDEELLYNNVKTIVFE